MHSCVVYDDVVGERGTCETGGFMVVSEPGDAMRVEEGQT